MNHIKTFPITSYVRAFFEKKLGHKTPKIRDFSNHPLKLPFLSLHIYAKYYTAIKAFDYMVLDLSGCENMLKYYQEHEDLFQSGAFGCAEFFTSFYREVEAELTITQELARFYDLPVKLYLTNPESQERDYASNIRIAIDHFCSRYGLGEDICSQDNLYRYYMFHKQRQRRLLA